MPASPTTFQWMIALVLLALFAWVLLSLFWDVVPLPWLQADLPRKRVVGSALLFAVGLLNYSFAGEVLGWVWMGIRHLLGLDLEGL